jgi:hypothetical protein
MNSSVDENHLGPGRNLRHHVHKNAGGFLHTGLESQPGSKLSGSPGENLLRGGRLKLFVPKSSLDFIKGGWGLQTHGLSPKDFNESTYGKRL